jgi:hypothetical protein
MLREMIENRIGKIDDDTFEMALDMATDDIKFNRISFGKRTSLSKALEIIISCVNVAQKIEKGSSEEPPTNQVNYIRYGLHNTIPIIEIA